jgi:hypothetical protein
MGLCAAILLFSSSLWAEMQMGGMEMEKEKKEPSKMVMTPKTAFVKEVLIEGVKAKFEVMTMEEHKKMLKEMKLSLEMVDKSATHHISVTLYDEKSGKEMTNAAVNMKVISPGKKEQVKMLTFMPEMKHYGNDFTLSEKGKYEILTLFKIGEQKRKGGFYYEVK